MSSPVSPSYQPAVYEIDPGDLGDIDEPEMQDVYPEEAPSQDLYFLFTQLVIQNLKYFSEYRRN